MQRAFNFRGYSADGFLHTEEFCVMAPDYRDPVFDGGPGRGGRSQDPPSGENTNPEVADAIGQALKAHYRAIADTPLPDRFLVLLAELEARERGNGP